MNKLFNKVAVAFVGIAMAIGVGVAVGASQKSAIPVYAAGSDVMVSNSSSDYYETGYLTGSLGTNKATWTCDAFSAEQAKNNSSNAVSLSYDEIRVYASHSFTITPKTGYIITSVILEATSTSYANAVGGSDLSNCKKSVSSTTVTLTPTDGEAAFSFTNTAQSRIKTISVNYTSGTPATINGPATAKAGTQWSPTSITVDDSEPVEYVTGVTYGFSATNDVVLTSNTSTGAFTAPAPCTVTVSAEKDGYNIADKTVTVSYADVTSVELSQYTATIAKNATFNVGAVTVTVNPVAYAEQTHSWSVQSNTVGNDYTWTSDTKSLKAGSTSGTITMRCTSGGQYADLVVTVSADPIVNLNKNVVRGYRGGTRTVSVSSVENLGTIASYEWSIVSATPSSTITIKDGTEDDSEVTLNLGATAETAIVKVRVTDTSSVYGEATCTVNAVESLNTITKHEDAYWELVTDVSTLSSGQKLVIASNADEETAGAISNDVMGDVTSTFSDDSSKITSLGSGTVELTLGGSSGAWTFTNSSSQLLGATAAKKVAWGSGTTTWSISISDGDATIQNGTASYGRFLHNVNSNRFTTYTSATSASMLLPQLYRYVAEKDIPLNNVEGKELTQQAVLNFVSTMNTDLAVCGTTGLTSSVWTTLAGKYTTANAEAQDSLLFENMLKYATATVRAQDGSATTGDALQNALARYNYILEKYGTDTEKGGYADFLGRAAAGTVTPKAAIADIKSFSSVQSDSTTLIIVVVSFVSLTAIGGYFLLKKRKENN